MKKLVWLTDLHLVEPGQDWPQDIDPPARLRVCLDEVQGPDRNTGVEDANDATNIGTTEPSRRS